MVTKKCPFCAEDIEEEAAYCQFCGSDLERKEKYKKLFLNERQETCLWIGVGIVDFIGGMILGGRILYDTEWSSLDVLLFVFLVAITTLSLMYSLQDRISRPKWQEWFIKHFKKLL